MPRNDRNGPTIPSTSWRYSSPKLCCQDCVATVSEHVTNSCSPDQSDWNWWRPFRALMDDTLTNFSTAFLWSDHILSVQEILWSFLAGMFGCSKGTGDRKGDCPMKQEHNVPEAISISNWHIFLFTASDKHVSEVITQHWVSSSAENGHCSSFRLRANNCITFITLCRHQCPFLFISHSVTLHWTLL